MYTIHSTTRRGYFFFLTVLLLSVVPKLTAQCPVGASATVDPDAATVTLTMSNGGTCGQGGFNWILDDQNLEHIDGCAPGVPSCTVQATYSSCMADGTHVFHVTGGCGFPGPNGSCTGSTGKTDASFVIDQKPAGSVNASRIGPGRFHVTVTYIFKQAPGKVIHVNEVINGQSTNIYHDQGPFGLSGTRSFDTFFGCGDSVQLGLKQAKIGV